MNYFLGILTGMVLVFAIRFFRMNRIVFRIEKK